MKKMIKGTSLLTTGICVLTTACMVGQAFNIENEKSVSAAQLTAREYSTVKTGIPYINIEEALVNVDSVELNIGVEDVLGSEESVSASIASNTQVGSGIQEVKEESVVAGYTNLGVAHVDNNLNIRKEPSEDAELAGKLPKNAGCEIFEIADGWAKIKSGKVEGYVKAEFLYTGEEAEVVAKEVMETFAVVNTQTLNVRLEASVDAGILCQVPQEEKLTVLEINGDWIKVEVDSDEGYVAKEFVEITTELDTAVTMKELKYGTGVSDIRVSIVQFAKQFLGNPYVWGGASLTNGADCSGFTMSIYRNFGIYLPHSSRAQANCGTRISTSELKPGDLIFYGSGSSINHVAMYIGGGQVIHASSKKTGIKISNAFYRNPICATRLLAD